MELCLWSLGLFCSLIFRNICPQWLSECDWIIFYLFPERIPKKRTKLKLHQRRQRKGSRQLLGAEKLRTAKVGVRAESPDLWQMKLHKQVLLQLQPLKSHHHLCHPHQNLVSSIYSTPRDPAARGLLTGTGLFPDMQCTSVFLCNTPASFLALLIILWLS